MTAQPLQFPKGRLHPSGRPIRPRVVKVPPVWRIPDKEPVTPRLRDTRKDLDCVGFVHDFDAERDE